MPVPLHKLCPTADAVAPDAELLDRFTTHRDERAFAELVRRHGPLVQRICRRLSPAVADDAFQSVFLALACRAGSVRAPGALAGWLVGVAGRIARQMRTAEQLRTNRLREAGARPLAVEPPDRTEHTDLAAALDDELTRLPDRLRDPIVLCLVLGQTHEQAAAELGGSTRTLRRRLERAKSVLRARLARRGSRRRSRRRWSPAPAPRGDRSPWNWSGSRYRWCRSSPKAGRSRERSSPYMEV
ncbi:RNA polymerase sigma factor [Frigoriglobus tundricola]|uniref:RNA polymerase sigma-70 region 2 domain-containing protein n=1 Tax=Frigoriglobus tundricola TaxID=2774151 RepID=A0A6M5YH90_9BACT|nr:sigma-70 family RNA polymerase sigma factor [Frigoriglobus tundricola]QJW93338.1 hypothetical protein FTUN_0844 [Frigoriglobus tundricola]